jgi:hypothetical protein
MQFHRLSLMVSCWFMTQCFVPYVDPARQGQFWPHEPINNNSEVTQNTNSGSVILITVDGIRWQEIFDGVDRAATQSAPGRRFAPLPSRLLLPNIYREFVDNGTVLGSPMAQQSFCVLQRTNVWKKYQLC